MPNDFDWLKKRAEILVDIANEFKTLNPTESFNVGSWSVIKLLTLVHFVPVYSSIIGSPNNKKYFQKMYYIDLMAGSGICRIEPTNDIIAGSALIALTQTQHPFDRYFIVEKSENTAKTLEQRMKKRTSNIDLFIGDCNTHITEIMNRIESWGSHFLAFVDCLGMDVTWTTMKKLFSKSGDVLFTFQTQEISREPPIVRNRGKGWEKLQTRLDAFFGHRTWETCKSPDDYLQYYMNNIKNETNRKIVLSFPVKGIGGYRYDMILATKETKGGSPWICEMEELQQRMNAYNSKTVDSILDIIHERQMTLQPNDQ